MTKRGLSNRSHEKREPRWYAVPGLLALAILVPAAITFCVVYTVAYVSAYGVLPW